jgi:hypothetical protein
MFPDSDAWTWRRHRSLPAGLRPHAVLLVMAYGFLALLLLCNDTEGRVVVGGLIAALTGFVLAVVLLFNVLPTRRLTRLDLLPADRPDRIRIVRRYRDVIHPIGALHALLVRRGDRRLDGHLHLDLTVDGVRRHVRSWAGPVPPDLVADLTRRLAHTTVDVWEESGVGEAVFDEDGLNWAVPVSAADLRRGLGQNLDDAPADP